MVDELLDQEGLDVDLPNRLEADTPLHKAVALVRADREAGLEVVDLLVDAGADPRSFPSSSSSWMCNVSG